MGREVHNVGDGGDPARAGSGCAAPTGGDPARIAPEVWDALVAEGENVRVAAGRLIYDAGDAPPVMAILSGGVRVFVRAPGGRQFTVRYARHGEVIGLAARLAGIDTSGAEAVADTTGAIIPLEKVRQLTLHNPAISWTLAEYIAAQAGDVVRDAAEVDALPMASRLARHLLQVCQVNGEDVARVTHQRLAEAAGTAREVVSRTLRAWRRDGVVRTSLGLVTISDPARLARIAQGEGGAAEVTGSS